MIQEVGVVMLEMEITAKKTSEDDHAMECATAEGLEKSSLWLNVNPEDGKTATYQDDFDEIGFANLISCL